MRKSEALFDDIDELNSCCLSGLVVKQQKVTVESLIVRVANQEASV